MPIQAEGKFAVVDVFRGSRLLARKSIVLLTILGLLLLAESVVLMLLEKGGWRERWYLFALGIFLIVYMWPYIYYRARRQIKRTPNLQSIVRYEFDEDGYVMTAAHSTADVKWTAVAKWKEGKHSFVMFANANIGSLIPKHFFQNSSDVDAFRGLLQAKVKKN